ncbi:MAG: ABC transporter substrate-binding protein [Spirochaetia bacterium]|jgi:multiple sugar transport system substrate-binding protein/sn-glycerol 3-phosphate transport system substrate-binding protein
MRRAIFILPLLLASFMLFSQGRTLAGVDPTGATITYWFQHSGTNGDAMQKMIADFNATNEWKITVKGEYAGPYDQIYNKMVAAIAAQNPPELVVAYQNQSATYAVSNALTDMNVYVNDPKWGLGKEMSDFFAGFINQDVNAQFGGMRLGFPPNRSLEVMYVNMALLKSAGIAAAPKTWTEFADDCVRVTNKDKGTYGYALDNLDASHIYAFVISRGGDFARADGKGYTLNTPQMKAVMAFMQGLVKQGVARKIPKKYDDQTDFGNGIAAFTTSSTSGLTYYAAAVNSNKNGPFAWAIAPIPQAASAGAPAMNLYGASVSIPKTTPAKQLAAWLFIKWFSEPKQQAQWAHVSKYFPVRKAAEPLIKDMLDADPNFAAAWAILKTANLKAEPPYAGYDLVRDAINAAYSSILDGADIDSTLAALQTKADKIFKDSAP